MRGTSIRPAIQRAQPTRGKCHVLQQIEGRKEERRQKGLLTMCQQIDRATPDGHKFLVYRQTEKNGNFRLCDAKEVLDAYGCSCDGIGKSCAANEDKPINADAGA